MIQENGGFNSFFTIYVNPCWSMQMDRLASIGEAAQALGVDITTLRRWERLGKISPAHTEGGHRRHDLAKLCPSLIRAKPDLNRKILENVKAAVESSSC